MKRFLALTALRRVWALIQAAFLAGVIWETRRYLNCCAADGLIEGRSLRAFRDQLEIDEWRRQQLLEFAGRRASPTTFISTRTGV